jgi:hypothetical protein
LKSDLQPPKKAASVRPRQSGETPAIDTAELKTLLRDFGDEAGHPALDSILTVLATWAGEHDLPHLTPKRT